MTDGRLSKGQETKARIIYATLEYIGEHGLKSMSAQKIAKSAGVSKSTIFHHFESVDDLPLLAMESIIDEMVMVIKNSSKTSLKAFLRELGEETFSISKREMNLFKAFFILFNESFHDQRYHLYLNRLKTRFSDLLKESILAIEEGVYDNRLDDICLMVSVLLDGYGFHYMSELDEDKYKRLWHMQVDMLVWQIEAIKK